jgi:predicted nucleic acid-binding Zn ribbon protein
MPLESCPTCGYALSIVDQHCRHCATAPGEIPSRPFDAKHLQQMIIMGVVVLSVLVYLIFVR